MKPLSLFVLLNLVFFIIQPHTGLLTYSYDNYTGYDGDVAARRHDAANATRIDRARDREARRAPAVESPEVFRAHFDDTLQDLKKSMLIVSIPLLALAMLVMYVTSGRRYAEHLVFSVHLGLRQMYGDSRLAAALRAGTLFFVMQILIAAYRDVLFVATLASL